MGGLKQKVQKKKLNQKMNKKENVFGKKMNKKKQFDGKQKKFEKKKMKNQNKQNKKKAEEDFEEDEEELEVEMKNQQFKNKKNVGAISKVENNDDDDEEEDDEELEEEDDDDEDEDEDDEDQEEEEEKDESEEEVDLVDVGDDDEDDEELPKQPKKVKKPIGSVQATQNQNNEGDEDSAIQTPSTRLFVSKLSKSTTNETLSKYFESNQIKLTDVFFPKQGSGYAFVGVENIEMAQKAVSLSGQTLDGSVINICFAKPRRGFQAPEGGDSQETNILFIKGLSASTTKETLQKHFSDASDIRLMTNPDGSCKGHAFIEYASAESAIAKKESMSGENINGSKVIVDFAAPRGSNRFNRGGFNKSRGGQDNRRGYGDRRGGFFGGNRGRAGKSFGGGRGGENRFGHRQRGGFRGGNQRGSFRGNRGRGGHVKFDDD